MWQDSDRLVYFVKRFDMFYDIFYAKWGDTLEEIHNVVSLVRRLIFYMVD